MSIRGRSIASYSSLAMVREVLLALAFAGLTGLGARVTIPLWPVPVTLQVLGVLLSGMVLGARLGGLSQAMYVAVGVMGLPVFAGGGSGPGWLAGPTGGYLVGFIAAGFITGLVAERLRGPRGLVLAGLIGLAAIYLFGAGWLALWLGDLGGAWRKGVAPFLLVDAVKVVAACIFAAGGRGLLTRLGLRLPV